MSPANHLHVTPGRLSVGVLFAVLSGAGMFAQGVQPSVESILKPGMTAWITDSAGHEEKAQIVGVAGDIVTTTAGQDVRRLRTTDIMRVRVRHADRVINGALIGGGAAVAAGLFLCSLTEPWENCRDDAGPMLGIGAAGAGIGIGVDALIRGRRTIYDAAQPSTRLHAAPVIGRHAAGLQLSFGF
jgi:hypothetical protein